jgi:hypothetical protein
MPGYRIEVFNRSGTTPTVEDKFIDCDFMINVDGNLEIELVLARRLIDMWFLFLRYHSDIDLDNITAKINRVRRDEFIGKSCYGAKIPDGLLDEAQKEAEERRKLNL